ncbi:MAG: YdcF family protein [Nostochopsis sp.]
MLALTGFILTLLLIIPIRLAIAKIQAPLPQAFLTLGGGPEREKLTAELARWYPSLEIWVSSGINPDEARRIFQAEGISMTRVHIDRRAVDTVTNFTTLVSDFKQHRIQHLYLITSSFHMPRAKAIATIILGSQGITFTPVSVPSNQSKESNLPILRDIGRSFFWMITGYTGASLKSDVVRY